MAFLLTGAFIGISFFSKLPTAIIVFVMFSLLAATGIINRYCHAMILILSGFFLWLLFHFTFFQTPADWWEVFNRSHVFMKSYSVSSLLIKYFYQFLDLIKTSFGGLYLSHILLVSGFALLVVLEKTKFICGSKKIILLLLVFMLTSIELCMKVSDLGTWGVNAINLHASWFFLLLIAAILNELYNCIIYKPVIKAWIPLLPLCLLLFCAPFAGAIGTSANIKIHMLFYMAPWFGLMLVFMIILSGPENSKIIIPASTLIIGIFVAAQILYGAVKPAAPYQADGILKLNEPTAIGTPVTSLKLDVETSRFYRDIRRKARENGFREGGDLLAFFDMPGLVFAMGGKSPGCTWYFGNYLEGGNDALEYVMGFVSSERLKKAFVLQVSDNQKLPDLEKFGIKFPQEYALCGAFLFPGTNNKIYLWKPQNFKIL
jgi:predicted nucleic acid-binding protein